MVLGSGSNILFPDEGYRGIIITLVGEFRNIKITEERILVGAGAKVQDVLNLALRNDLIGLECVAGIPGTVGAAVYGNVGTKKDAVDSCVESVIIYKDAKKKNLNKDQINFSYRKSSLEDCIIVNVGFILKKETKNDSLSAVSKSLKERLKSQPLDMPNVGCIFKNPVGYSAGKLIEEANLKGFQIGGAKVSNKHGNFIVNTGKATSKDVITLIDIIKEKVNCKFNIALETEIKIINDK